MSLNIQLPVSWYLALNSIIYLQALTFITTSVQPQQELQTPTFFFLLTIVVSQHLSAITFFYI